MNVGSSTRHCHYLAACKTLAGVRGTRDVTSLSTSSLLRVGQDPHYAPSPTGRREERERALTRRLKRRIQKWKKSGP